MPRKLPTSTGTAKLVLNQTREEAAPFPRRGLTFLLAFLAISYFWALGHMPLLDPDEPVYAETGKLMAMSHLFADWWTPHYNGGLWFDKPPLTYWLIGLSMRLFGVSELSARLPCAVAGLLLIAVTARMTWRLFPTISHAPLWSAMVIGTCLQTMILTHGLVTDMFLAVALTSALLLTWEWLESDSVTSILAAGVIIGIGALIKGPVAIVLIGAQILLFLIFTKQAARFLSWRLWLALALSLAVAAPWYVSMVVLHGRYFVQAFLEAQNISRFLSAEHPRTASPLFFVPVLIAGFLPWTFALIPALMQSAKEARNSANSYLFCLIWILLVFVFFSASQSKLVTYIFPLYPLAACLAGAWLAKRSEEKSQRIAAAAMATVFVLLGIALIIYAPKLAALGSTLTLIGAVLIVGAIIAVAISEKSRYTHLAFVMFGICFGLIFPLVASSPYWNISRPELSAKEMAGDIAMRSKPGDTIYALTYNRPSLVYYSDRNIIFTDKQELVGPAVSHPPYPICVTKREYIDQMLAKHLLAPYKILSQRGKTSILIQCKPSTRDGI